VPVHAPLGGRVEPRERFVLPNRQRWYEPPIKSVTTASAATFSAAKASQFPAAARPLFVSASANQRTGG
jgi:hypothetical protein